MRSDASIIVEFYGIPRERAGCSEIAVAPGTLGDVLEAVERRCPQFKDLCNPMGGISAHYRVSLDGQRFLTDGGEILPGATRLLVLSADVGG